MGDRKKYYKVISLTKETWYEWLYDYQVEEYVQLGYDVKLVTK